jgi:uncharacterized protein YdeI (YjbR/CyaY-like superfamily)
VHMSDPVFFPTPAKFRAWLRRHHAKKKELWVGYYHKKTGKPTMTWSDSVDEALCYGWIDGIRKSHAEGAYKIRFTPRKPTSVWSNINIAKVAALTTAGRMMPAGIAAFAQRKADKSGIASFERTEPAQLEPAMEKAFRRNKGAWTYFQSQAPYYRRLATHYVVSAKKEETRQRRFENLLAYSGKGERLPQTLPSGKKPAM